MSYRVNGIAFEEINKGNGHNQSPECGYFGKMMMPEIWRP
jgi:hypothetical protein